MCGHRLLLFFPNDEYIRAHRESGSILRYARVLITMQRSLARTWRHSAPRGLSHRSEPSELSAIFEEHQAFPMALLLFASSGSFLTVRDERFRACQGAGEGDVFAVPREGDRRVGVCRFSAKLQSRSAPRTLRDLICSAWGLEVPRTPISGATQAAIEARYRRARTPSLVARAG